MKENVGAIVISFTLWFISLSFLGALKVSPNISLIIATAMATIIGSLMSKGLLLYTFSMVTVFSVLFLVAPAMDVDTFVHPFVLVSSTIFVSVPLLLLIKKSPTSVELGGGRVILAEPALNFYIAEVIEVLYADHSYSTQSLERDYLQDNSNAVGYEIKNTRHVDERQHIWFRNLITGVEFKKSFKNNLLEIRSGQRLCIGESQGNNQIDIYHNYSTNENVNVSDFIPSKERIEAIRRGVSIEGFFIGLIPYIGLFFALLAPVIWIGKLTKTESSYYDGMIKRLFPLWIVSGTASTILFFLKRDIYLNLSISSLLLILLSISLITARLSAIITKNYHANAEHFRSRAIQMLETEARSLRSTI